MQGITRVLTLTATLVIPGHSQLSPAFEVISIKPSQAGARESSMHVQPGGQTYLVKNTSVRFMILRVFHLIEDQIVGGPAWLNTSLFDVEAKAEHPGKLEQLNRMFQSLLAERFKLQYHRETRQLPAYALVVDKKVTKLKVNDTADEFSGRIGPNIGRLPGMTGVGVSIRELCWALSLIIGRPVLDRTALTGFYDFKLEWTTDPRLSFPVEGGDAPPTLEGPTIFNAIRDAGLKLESRRGPVEVMVIDSIEKPLVN
jgi:uncharacterized protein (TIGR03435 family)